MTPNHRRERQEGVTMRFRVERDEFTEAVAWTARTLPSRPTTQLQVLSGLLLDATGPMRYGNISKKRKIKQF